MNIDRLKSAIGAHKNVAVSNRYEVKIFGPTIKVIDSVMLSLFATSVQIPSRNIFTSEFTNGNITLKNPYTYNDEDITISFILTNDYIARNVFETWINKIIDNQQYIVGYKSEYTGTVEISHLSQQNKEVHRVKLIEAYPITMSAIELSSDAENQVSKLDVTFTYTKYISDNNPTN